MVSGVTGGIKMKIVVSQIPCSSQITTHAVSNLLVIGTVARTGIVGRVVGNTAEKILDQTESDVLVISRSAADLI